MPNFNSSLLNFICYLIIFWSSLHVIRRVVKVTRVGVWGRKVVPMVVVKFVKFLSKWWQFELQLSTVSLTLSTRHWNSLVRRVGKRYRRFWRCWFGCGVGYGILASLVGLGLLVYAVTTSLQQLLVTSQSDSLTRRGLPAPHREPSSPIRPVLLPMIPGLTLPLSDVPLYVLSFLLAGVVHELGHALAGAAQGVPLHRFGVVFTLVYPGAFVELDTFTLNQLSPFQHMQVVCGGVWHNFILALVGLLLLQSGLFPFTLTLFRLYTPPRCPGWVVTHTKPSSLSSHLQPGSTVVRINDIQLFGQPKLAAGNWPSPLAGRSLTGADKSVSSSPTGFCVANQDWQTLDDTCCHTINYNLSVKESPACFKALASNLTVSVYQKHMSELNQGPNNTCLSASTTFQKPGCSGSTSCDVNSTCVSLAPALDPTYQWTRLYVVKKVGLPDQVHSTDGSTVKSNNNPSSIQQEADTSHVVDTCEDTRMILHLGDPREIPYLVTVSELEPHFKWLPFDLPRVVLSFLSYLQAFSFALGILNILPVFYLDGQFLLKLVLPSLYGYLIKVSPPLYQRIHPRNWLPCLNNQTYQRVNTDIELQSTSSPVISNTTHPHSSQSLSSLEQWILRSSSVLLIFSIGLSLLALL